LVWLPIETALIAAFTQSWSTARGRATCARSNCRKRAEFTLAASASHFQAGANAPNICRAAGPRPVVPGLAERDDACVLAQPIVLNASTFGAELASLSAAADAAELVFRFYLR
jgi:hypothetical protein